MYVTANGTQLALSAASQQWFGSIKSGSTLTGTSQNDAFYASGSNTIAGGLGDDIYYTWDTQSHFVEKANQGTDTVYSYAYGQTTLDPNIENLFLLGDYSTGGIGNAQNNIIAAGATGAYLDGGAGDDVLVGGAGRDTFEIHAGNGSDAIENFTPGADLVQIDGYSITSFAMLLAKATQVGSDVSIALSSTEKLVIRNTTLSQISATDFRLLNNNGTTIGSASTLSSAAASTVQTTLASLAGPARAYTFNGWYVLNNVWNPGSLVYGTDYQISSSYNKADPTVATTFTWSFPTVALTPGVSAIPIAYPEMIFGPAPQGGGQKSTDTAGVFPIQLSALSTLKANYNLTYGGDTSGYDVSYDIWLTNKAGGNASTITNEVMIWVHQGTFQAFGDRIGTYQDGTFAATIYYDAARHYTAIVANQDTPAGSIDITKIFAKLESLGIVSSSEYLGSVELGAEVASGSGSLTVNNLSLDVESKAADGSTVVKTVTGAGVTTTTISDTVRTATNYTLAATETNLAAADPAATTPLVLTGNALANTITGNAGDNVLDGGAGADTLIGGAGNDTYYVDNANDVVIEAVGGGTDTVVTTVNYALGAGQEIENLRAITGTSSLTLTGNEFDNTLYANAGTDTLIGGAGNDKLNSGTGVDTLIGGTGNDSYYVQNSADIIIEKVGEGNDWVTSSVNYTLGAGQEIETLAALAGTSAINLTGNEFANTLIGNDGNETLNGGAGNDIIKSGLGIQTLIGGTGDDTFYVNNSKDSVIEAVGGGTDTVYASVNFTLGAGQEVENLRAVSGTTSLTLTGNEFDNTLYANAGTDTLIGGAGNDKLNSGTGVDTLIGGTGNDSYYVQNSADIIIEKVGEGNDWVTSSVNYTLGAGQEIETLAALAGTSAINLTGNEFANTLIGNDGNETLNGGAGNDILKSGLGNQTLIGGTGDDKFVIALGNVHDVISDFGNGHDTLDLTAFTKAGYAPTISLSNGNTLLSFGNGATVTLSGVTPSHLSQSGGMFTSI